jgi:hypothetical protein
MCGLPGVGKTTLSRKIEKNLDAIRLSQDEMREKIIPDKTEKYKLDALQGPILGLIRYLTGKLLRADNIVILENGFWNEEDRELHRKIAEKHDAEVELYFFDFPKEKIVERVLKRNKSLGFGQLHVSKDEIDEWYEIFEPPTTGELKKYSKYKIIRPEDQKE